MASSSTPMGMSMTIAGIKKKFPEVKNVDTDTLNTWVKESTGPTPETGQTDGQTTKGPLVILDVRPKEEFCISSIPSALNVDPEERDMEKVKKIITDNSVPDPNKSVQVVMFCSVGYRSSALATRLQRFVNKEGDSSVDVYNLEGSIFKWANENRKLVDSEGQDTKFVHPYSKFWGLLLDSDRRKTSP